MFESIMKFFKKLGKTESNETKSKQTAKERLHLVLMQDRANVSADFLEMMKQEIIEVIKKYIEVDEKEIDVRLTNDVKDDGTTGAPSLYANIPIMNIKNEMKKEIEQQANNKIEENKEQLKKEDVEKPEKESTEKRQEENVANNEETEKQETTENNEEESKKENNEENKSGE